jgi:hypothetical protein
LCQYLISGVCFNYSNIWGGGIPPTQTQCETWFTGAFQAGLSTDTNVNTIGCRQHYATLGQTAGSEYYCKFASFTGGGVCGSNVLNNTCAAIMSICPAGTTSNPYTTITDCLTDLNPLNTTIGSKQGLAGQSENSLECRTYHATAGTTVAAAHCGHMLYTGGPCSAGAVVPLADHYCGLSELTCTGSGAGGKQQYGQGNAPLDAANHYLCCTNSFNSFPVGAGVVFNGATNDQSGRMYHLSANAVNGGNTVHCSHAGPSGGGVVGGQNGSRASWLWISNNTQCQTAGNAYVYLQIAQATQYWPNQLLTVVPKDTNVGTYNVGDSSAQANTDTCRIYHLNFAAGAHPSHCAHGSILGGGQCPADPSIPACLLVMAACPNAYSSAATCQADFGAYFTANPPKLGDPCGPVKATPVVPTTDDVACRLYYATLAVTSVGMGQTASATQCMNAAIKGATGCGVAALPTKGDAASLAVSSSLLALLAMLW